MFQNAYQTWLERTNCSVKSEASNVLNLCALPTNLVYRVQSLSSAPVIVLSSETTKLKKSKWISNRNSYNSVAQNFSLRFSVQYMTNVFFFNFFLIYQSVSSSKKLSQFPKYVSENTNKQTIYSWIFKYLYYITKRTIESRMFVGVVALINTFLFHSSDLNQFSSTSENNIIFNLTFRKFNFELNK